MAENNNYLLVLGNGFDIGCGLRCTYNDFFIYLKNNNFLVKENKFSETVFGEQNSQWLRKLTVNSSFSIWEFYFILVYRKQKDIDKLGWYDIETEMESSLSDGGFWDSVFDSLVRNTSNKFNNLFKPEGETNFFSFAAYILHIRYYVSGPYYISGGKEDFYKCLLDELYKFESKFGKYISDLVGEDYRIIRDRHLDIIFKKLGDNLNYKIISFNYSSIKNSDSLYKIEHVHGTVEHPIFGISTNNDESPLKLFDKVTRRRDVDSGLPTYESILKKNEGNHYNLVFYGLSFAKSDLEDFKILFHYLGLGDKIYVLYPDYGHERRKKEVHDNFMNLYQEIYASDENGKVSAYEEEAPLEFIPVKF